MMFAGLQRPRGHRNGRAPARIESLAAAAGLAPAAIKELVEPAPVARPLTLLVSTPCTEPWNVRRALHGKEPISGTHTALLAVARAFARHGWQVTVAGNVDPPTGDAIITDWVGDTITSFPRGWRAAANITYLPSCLQSASKRSRAPLPFAPGPHRIALAEANWEQSNATRCCTDRDPEPRRVGRCRYRAEQTRCATAAGASCPVACQQCVLCPTHPMMPVYATAYPYADLGMPLQGESTAIVSDNCGHGFDHRGWQQVRTRVIAMVFECAHLNRVHRRSLNQYFRNVARPKLHFFHLSRWGRDAYRAAAMNRAATATGMDAFVEAWARNDADSFTNPAGSPAGSAPHVRRSPRQFIFPAVVDRGAGLAAEVVARLATHWGGPLQSGATAVYAYYGLPTTRQTQTEHYVNQISVDRAAVRFARLGKSNLSRELLRSTYFIYGLADPLRLSTHFDTFSYAVLECLLHGVLVLAPRLGALPDLYDGLVTFIDPPGGLPDWARLETQSDRGWNPCRYRFRKGNSSGQIGSSHRIGLGGQLTEGSRWATAAERDACAEGVSRRWGSRRSDACPSRDMLLGNLLSSPAMQERYVHEILLFDSNATRREEVRARARAGAHARFDRSRITSGMLKAIELGLNFGKESAKK